MESSGMEKNLRMPKIKGGSFTTGERIVNVTKFNSQHRGLIEKGFVAL